MFQESHTVNLSEKNDDGTDLTDEVESDSVQVSSRHSTKSVPTSQVFHVHTLNFMTSQLTSLNLIWQVLRGGVCAYLC